MSKIKKKYFPWLSKGIVGMQLWSYVTHVKKVNPLLTQWHLSQYIIYHSQGPTQNHSELWPTEIVLDRTAEDTFISLKRKSESRPLGIS